MTTMKFPSGCMTALITPLQEDGRLCEQSFQHVVETQVQAGIAALVIMGTTGESITHSADEKVRIIEYAVHCAQGRIPIIAGVSDAATAQACALIERVHALDIAGCMSVTPYYNTPTQEGLYAHFAAIASHTDKPLMVYNVPHRTGVDMLPATVGKLAEISNICAVKDAVGGDRAPDLMQVHQDYPHLSIFSGNDTDAAHYGQSGAHGLVSVLSNLLPQTMVELVDLSRQSHVSSAASAESSTEGVNLSQGVQRNVDRVLQALAHCGPNPLGVKAAMALYSVIETETVRLPLLHKDEQSKAIMQQELLSALANLHERPPSHYN